MLRASIDSLFVEIRTVFTELVTFTRSVIFEGLVTFKDKVVFEARVTFSDPDMAGAATISAGTRRVHVEFRTPYIEVPIVTIASNGHYKLGTLKNVNRNGFDIEVAEIAENSLEFNWIALLVTGAGNSASTPVLVEQPSEDSPGVNDAQVT
jgi:hypothetical protein